MPAEGLAVLLRSFRLPTMAASWEESVSRAERENWGYKRLLQHLCESEEQDRRERQDAGEGPDGVEAGECQSRGDGHQHPDDRAGAGTEAEGLADRGTEGRGREHPNE